MSQYVFEVDGNYVNFNGGGNLWRLHKDSNCISWHWDESGDLFFDVYDQEYVVKAENIGQVVVGGVTLSTAADFETNIKIVFPGLAGGGSSSYLVATKILTDDEIKALPTTGIEIIAAPGSNKMIQPVFMTLIADTNLAEYTNIHANGYLDLSSDGGAYWGVIIGNRGAETLTDLTTLLGITGNGWFSSVVQNWAVSSSYYAMYMPNVLEISTVINKSVKITCGNSGAGNFTGGNAANTLKVILQYIIIDLS